MPSVGRGGAGWGGWGSVREAGVEGPVQERGVARSLVAGGDPQSQELWGGALIPAQQGWG